MYLITKVDQKTRANATYFTKVDHFWQKWIIAYKSGSFHKQWSTFVKQKWIKSECSILIGPRLHHAKKSMLDSDWSAAEPRGRRLNHVVWAQEAFWLVERFHMIVKLWLVKSPRFQLTACWLAGAQLTCAQERQLVDVSLIK